MKAFEIMEKLYGMAPDTKRQYTCDTCKAGESTIDVERVAVAMFPTPEVINRAKKWGAQLLIVHEPTYYNHMDEHSDEKIETEKRKLIEESGMTIYRYHDSAHDAEPDVIERGMLRQFGLSGRIEHTAPYGRVRLILDNPVTPLELAKVIEKQCDIKHLRICGARNERCSVISGMFGTPGGVFDELKSAESEIVLTGEACEWSLGEYARDAAQLGYKKALIIMGHIGSEREGVKYSAELLKEIIPELEVKYFECGEVYTYTDSNDME